MLAAERLTPFCRRGAATLTLKGRPADMVRLVRTLRVRRGAMPGQEEMDLRAWAGMLRLVRTLRVRRGGPRRQARTLSAIQFRALRGEVERCRSSR